MKTPRAPIARRIAGLCTFPPSLLYNFRFHPPDFPGAPPNF